MSYFLISHSQVEPSQLLSLKDLPEYRKATPAMMMATHSAQAALQVLPKENRAEVALVLGTSLGELETTLEFLTTYYSTRMARPVLFQNSLHNAILGFMTIQLGLTGPSTTVSLMDNTFRGALRVAELFLQLNPFVLVTLAEHGEPHLRLMLQETSMRDWKTIDFGASYLFATAEAVQRYQLKTIAGYDDLQAAHNLNFWLK